MKGLVTGLLLGWGCLAGAAAAQEVQWRAAAPPPAPASLASSVALGQPRPLGPATPAPRIVRASAEAIDAPAPPPQPAPSPEPALWGTFGCDGAPASVSPDGAIPVPDAFGPERPRFWARAEYLMWWFRDQQAPPLVTTGPFSPTSTTLGFLGAPGTVVLVGGELEGDLRSGARFTAGGWCDEDGLVGAEASGFLIGQRSARSGFDSSQFPVLARPFFSLNTMAESAQESTTPGRSIGTVNVEAPSSLWGVEADLRCNLCCGCYCGWAGRLDFLTGLRYLQLNEGLHISESLLGLAGAGSFAGSHIFVTDRFDTRNRFYGSQVGLDYELTRGPWSLGLVGKVALGATHQEVDINGGQVVVSPTGAVSTFNGGLLALASNIGSFSRDRFAVVPEGTVTLGYRVTDWCRLSVGYNFLYCSSVLRPGNQIDRVLDETLIPNFKTGVAPAGQSRPAPILHGSDFWAQGLNFGVEFRF